MQNIINRPIVVIWLPFAAMTMLVVLSSLLGINFTQSIFDFIVGNPYDIIAVFIGCLWLSSACWGLVAHLNKEVFSSNVNESNQTQGSLYKITSLRENALKHVSAVDYNNESLKVIRQLNPTSQLLPKEEPIQEVKEAEVAKNTSEKLNEGEKKPQTTQPQEPKSSTTTPAKNKSDNVTTKGAPYAVVNTAIKGESFATDDAKAKYTEILRKIADKRKLKAA